MSLVISSLYEHTVGAAPLEFRACLGFAPRHKLPRLLFGAWTSRHARACIRACRDGVRARVVPRVRKGHGHLGAG
eukprot:scaffold10_cov257-Pinguiococcus_pyrenoidosus.AAC.42